MTCMVLYRFYHNDVCVAHMYYVNCPVVDACMYLTLGKWLRQEVRASVLHIPEDRWAYKRHRVELEICMIRVRTEHSLVPAVAETFMALRCMLSSFYCRGIQCICWHKRLILSHIVSNFSTYSYETFHYFQQVLGENL